MKYGFGNIEGKLTGYTNTFNDSYFLYAYKKYKLYGIYFPLLVSVVGLAGRNLFPFINKTFDLSLKLFNKLYLFLQYLNTLFFKLFSNIINNKQFIINNTVTHFVRNTILYQNTILRYYFI